MAYEAKSRLHAAARTAGDGTVLGQRGFASVARTGTGVYEYTLEAPLGVGRRTVQAHIGGAPAGVTSLQTSWTSDTVLLVETFGVTVEFDVPTDAEHTVALFSLTSEQ